MLFARSPNTVYSAKQKEKSVKNISIFINPQKNKNTIDMLCCVIYVKFFILFMVIIGQ